jgi:Zn-dependent protease
MHNTGWFLLGFCAILGISLAGWWFGLPLAALVVASLLVHEAGHMSAAIALHVPVREFGLRLGGAYTQRAYAGNRRDEILISAAGPLANLSLVLPLLFVPQIGTQLALCNLVLGVANLLPIPASDGLRILRTLASANAPGSLTPVLIETQRP